AGPFGRLGKLDGGGRVVAARAGNHRHATGSGTHRGGNDLALLGQAEQGGLARGTAGHQPGRAALDLAQAQLVERPEGDRAEATGGGERGERAVKRKWNGTHVTSPYGQGCAASTRRWAT